VEKVGKTDTGIVQYAICLSCFRKHMLKDPKGIEEDEEAILSTVYLETQP
jgi:hypothetical protein